MLQILPGGYQVLACALVRPSVLGGDFNRRACLLFLLGKAVTKDAIRLV